MRIGIAGLAGSGKSTIGLLLAKNIGYEQYAYADPLKELCVAFIPELPWYGNKKEKETNYLVRDLDFNFMEYENTIGLRYDVLHMINMYFLDILENKEYVNAREVLQYIGTDIVRNHQEYDFWVNLGKTKEDVVITDVRFENELVDYNIKIYGGVSTEGDNHISEVEIPDEHFDLILENKFSENPEEQLQQLVKTIMENLPHA